MLGPVSPVDHVKEPFGVLDDAVKTTGSLMQLMDGVTSTVGVGSTCTLMVSEYAIQLPNE